MPDIRATEPLVVKASVAARMLDCSRQHIYTLCESGALRRIHLGESRSVRIPVADIRALIADGPDTSDLS